MRDSMFILGKLADRGYVPQDEAREGEGWYDRFFPNPTKDKILRVVLTSEGAAELYGFDRWMCLEWEASFQASTPPSVFLAALDAAEREASRQRDDSEFAEIRTLIDKPGVVDQYDGYMHAFHGTPAEDCDASTHTGPDYEAGFRHGLEKKQQRWAH